MPHLRLEYSANCPPRSDLTQLFSALHDVLVDVGGILRENCKSRAYEAQPFLVADGSPGQDGKPRGFVHLDVRFMDGRSHALKQAVGAALRDVLLQYYNEALEKLELQVTVEIRDIDHELYFKYPEGTLTPQ